MFILLHFCFKRSNFLGMGELLVFGQRGRRWVWQGGGSFVRWGAGLSGFCWWGSGVLWAISGKVPLQVALEATPFFG